MVRRWVIGGTLILEGLQVVVEILVFVIFCLVANVEFSIHVPDLARLGVIDLVVSTFFVGAELFLVVIEIFFGGKFIRAHAPPVSHRFGLRFLPAHAE